MKKFLSLMLAMALTLTAAVACAETITVVSREAGSGTRSAFIELTGVEVKNEAGEKVDTTTLEAVTMNGTAQVITTVEGDKNAIGYISLGPDGQAIVSEKGYVSGEPASYDAAPVAGKVVVGGSSSVGPLMEKLAEAYQAINPNVTIEVQISDSTTGVKGAIDGSFDIGMASRELKDSEVEAGLTSVTLCMDGIAVIVNLDNPVDELTREQIRTIFTGETEDWSQLAQ